MPKPPPFPPVPLEAVIKDLREKATQGYKEELERVKQKLVAQAYSRFDKHLEDVVSQYVNIMHNEGLKAANQVRNPTYL